jgi:hypothetical protein
MMPDYFSHNERKAGSVPLDTIEYVPVREPAVASDGYVVEERDITPAEFEMFMRLLEGLK